MAATSDPDPSQLSGIADILTPGSSLNPTFLLIVDGVFAFLLLVLLSLLALTWGNLHFFALIAIELALWASVKWFVSELRKAPVVQQEETKKEQ
ncbi:hypothetical protein PLICRDRAFT_34231 [Plicaturopsis crispa FD-325 SS-3]|nr:hypothetical protein PLICRDRAFT_34231 [Plicaturopsis crispa FD-325 SS-3]